LLYFPNVYLLGPVIGIFNVLILVLGNLHLENTTYISNTFHRHIVNI